MTRFLIISVKLIYANKDYDRIANDTILHLLAHVLPFCFSAEIVIGDRWQILRYVSNELLNTHKIPIKAKCNDEKPQICGKFMTK